MPMVYPPLSLRDISPTRGEIVLFPGSITGRNEECRGVTDNLPPCGGDVGVADRGGYARLDCEVNFPCP